MAWTRITSGVTTSADEVNNNFILVNSGDVLPYLLSDTASNTTGVYDVGSATYKWRRGYFNGSISCNDLNVIDSITAISINVTNTLSAGEIKVTNAITGTSWNASSLTSKNLTTSVATIEVGRFDNENGITYNTSGNESLNFVLISIGSWNMNSIQNLTLSYSVSSIAFIRSIRGVVINDSQSSLTLFGQYQTIGTGLPTANELFIHRADANSIFLKVGSSWNGKANHQSTLINRGYIFITYG